MKRAWILWAALLGAFACGDAHTTDEGGADMRTCSPSDSGPPPGCFLDACCEAIEPATLDPATCRYTCSRGSLTCAPAPGCGSCSDAGAGPPAPCVGGPCCDEFVSPLPGPGCSFECPSGYSRSCEIDPAAFCAPDPRSCDTPDDCVVTANTCCGECGEATLAGSTSVNGGALESYRDGLCEGDPICPACAQSPNPELVATCASNRCDVVDIGMRAVTECTSSDQCVVRTVDCCECGGRTDRGSLIALRADRRADFEALVCGTDGVACPECAPVYPDDVTAICDLGRCTLVYDP